jgi:hypothetical protein
MDPQFTTEDVLLELTAEDFRCLQYIAYKRKLTFRDVVEEIRRAAQRLGRGESDV